MKRLLALLIALLMVFSIVGCDTKTDSDDDSDETVRTKKENSSSTGSLDEEDTVASTDNTDSTGGGITVDTENTVTVMFNANGGIIMYGGYVVSVQHGGSLNSESLPHVEREGYIFKGWTYDRAGNFPWSAEHTFTENDMLYAAWMSESDSSIGSGDGDSSASSDWDEPTDSSDGWDDNTDTTDNSTTDTGEDTTDTGEDTIDTGKDTTDTTDNFTTDTGGDTTDTGEDTTDTGGDTTDTTDNSTTDTMNRNKVTITFLHDGIFQRSVIDYGHCLNEYDTYIFSPTKENHVFLGWAYYTNGEDTVYWDKNDIIYNDTELYAVWEPIGTTETSEDTTGSGEDTTDSSANVINPSPTPDVPSEEAAPAVKSIWEGKTLNILATVWDTANPSAPWSQVELTVPSDDLYSDENFGQIINMAVLQREEFIMDNYGVALNWINARGNRISSVLAESVVSGANGRFHIAMPRVMETQSIVATNTIYKINDNRYIDLTRSYYNQSSVEAFTLCGNTLFAGGDFSFLEEQAAYVMYYNVAITKGLESFPNLYQLVKEGKWTVDEMINFAKLLVKNEGDVAWTDDDIYGYGTTNMSRFYQYSGIQQVSALGGTYEITLNSSMISPLITKINTIRSADWSRTEWDGGHTAIQNAFKEGRLMFCEENVQNIHDFDNQNEEFIVGVLPAPKLTESQDKYYTPCEAQSVVMCIPKATDDREMSSYFFEVLSYTGQKYLTEAYYKNLSSKFTADIADEAMDVLKNYVFAGICYDVGYAHGFSGLLTEVQEKMYRYSGYSDIRYQEEIEADLEEAAKEMDNWNLAWFDYAE